MWGKNGHLTKFITNLFRMTLIKDMFVRSQKYEKRLLASSSLSVCLSVHPSVHMQQLGYSSMDFIVIQYGACAFHVF